MKNREADAVQRWRTSQKEKTKRKGNQKQSLERELIEKEGPINRETVLDYACQEKPRQPTFS